MAATDARPIPIKNTAYRITFPILDADGDLVTGAASLDSEVSKDAGTFTDCTNEATEIATSSGMYYLDLTSTEMNADTVAVIVKTSTSGAKTTPIVLYPQEAGDIKVDVESIDGTAMGDNGPLPWFGVIDYGTAQSVTGTTIVLRAGITVSNDVLIGATVWVYSSTNGLHERRVITDWDSATDTATVDTWTQTPTGTILYVVFATAPSTTGTVFSANVVQISGDSTAADNLEAAWDGTGSVTMTANITGNLSGSVASVSGAVGSVTGAVGSVAGAVTVGTVNSGAADTIWDEPVDGTTTARESMRLHNAVLGGKASGLETTTAVYRDLADTKNRVSATVDTDGNRSAVTRDLT